MMFRLGFCSVSFTGRVTTWANVMNFGLNHAPGAGSIPCPVNLQSSALPLFHGCFLLLC